MVNDNITARKLRRHTVWMNRTTVTVEGFSGVAGAAATSVVVPEALRVVAPSVAPDNFGLGFGDRAEKYIRWPKPVSQTYDVIVIRIKLYASPTLK